MRRHPANSAASPESVAASKEGPNTSAILFRFTKRSRQGKIMSTVCVESAVNQSVSKRSVKKQQTRWTPAGAHLRLQIRAQALNGDGRATLSRWYPGMPLTPEPKEA